MSDQEYNADDIEAKVHDLAEAMQRIKNSQADRDDVVVDMKQAQRARLELLADDLQPVFDKVPSNADQFEFAMTSGEPPRLWIDMTAFVTMGADRRTYVFTKDTRLGRTILAESDDRRQVGRRVSDYVAERILERERMIEGDWISAHAQTGAPSQLRPRKPSLLARISAILAWLTLGIIAGAAMLFAWAWYELPFPL